jgi:prepilin-type N-terminal cleavage/methylation domain-containing protein
MSRRGSTTAHTGRRGFTLLELSIVLSLIAVIIGMGLVILTSSLQASQYNATVARMDAIDQTLLNFSIANSRIPCPSDLTQTVSSATYGVEAATSAGALARANASPE